jgi:hypothetical protein
MGRLFWGPCWSWPASGDGSAKWSPSTTSPSQCRTARSSVSSDRTEPARRRRCGSPSACWSPIRVRCAGAAPRQPATGPAGGGLVHEPDVLVLDEPFSGLDPVVDVLAGVLREQSRQRGVPVVFSSHQLDLVERLCDWVVLIGEGRIRAQGTIEDLRASRARNLWRIRLEGVDDWQEAVPGVTVVGSGPAGFLVELERSPIPNACSTSRDARGGHALRARSSEPGRALPRGGRLMEPAMIDGRPSTSA